MKKSLLIMLISFSAIHGGAQTTPRPRAICQGIFGAHTASIVAVSIGITVAAVGIAIIATNDSQTSHAH